MSDDETLSFVSESDEFTRFLKDILDEIHSSREGLTLAIKSLKRDVKTSCVDTTKEIKELSERIRVMETSFEQISKELQGLHETLQTTVTNLQMVGVGK